MLWQRRPNLHLPSSALVQHGKLAWLADLDMWRFSSPPVDLADIIFTSGYSIENDLYSGSEIESLMESAERSQHRSLITPVCRWFAFEVVESQAGRSNQCATHINKVIDYTSMDISPVFMTHRGFVEPDPVLVSSILSDYKMQLRGKTLVEVLVKFLSDSNRNPKHSKPAIIELCLKLYPNNPYIQRIIAVARTRLS